MKHSSHRLELRNLSFCRNKTCILKQLSFSLEASQIGAIVGPSGSGKTTLLRLIAGFEKPSEGEILVGDRVISSANEVISPEHRRVGVVFQDFALFPHLTVSENISFSLFKESSAKQKNRENFLLNLLSLEELAHRYPHQLSGGQQQRAALGRALAPEPSLLLLDEPFSQLDPELREELIEVMSNVLKETRITTLLVTHHQEDAFDLSHQLGVLQDGKMLQWGDPFELYHSPKNKFVADFVGKGIFLPAKVVEKGIVECELGRFPCVEDWKIGQECELLVRPDDILHVDGAPFRAKLLQKRFRGSVHLYTLELPSSKRLLALVPSHHNHHIGEEIGIRVEMDHVNLYPKK